MNWKILAKTILFCFVLLSASSGVIWALEAYVMSDIESFIALVMVLLACLVGMIVYNIYKILDTKPATPTTWPEMTELEQIKPEFRESFQRFVDTGEADEAFLEYMDADEACQQAIDVALRKQAEEVRAFAEALREIR